jgi:predicted permease
MMDNFMIIMAYLLIGMGLRRLPQFPGETGKSLVLFVIYVSLPSVILLKIPELTLSTELLTPVLMPWVMLLVSCGVVLLLSRALKWDRAITGCLLLLVPMGNTSFLGIPMVKAFFGEEGIPYALLYDQTGSFLALATYGSVIIAIYGGEGGRPALKDVLKKVFTFPPFIAFILAMILRSTPYPAVLVNMLGALGGTLVPVVMIAVGFQLSLRLSKEAMVPLSIGLALKMIAAPIFALALCRALGLQGMAADVSIFESGMPPMISAGALAIVAGLSPTLAAAMVGLGIILSFVTLPTLHFFL